jgi:hypothetical protein
MLNARSATPFSKIAFMAMLVGLFLLFTPFEESGAHRTMMPKYFAAGASMFLFAPLIVFRRVQFTQPSLLVLVVLLTIIFHGVVAKPVPAQFVLLIAANLALAIVLYEARFAYRKEFEAAVACLLVINALAIAVQVGLFYFVTHAIYDIHHLLFGSQSRVTEDFLNIARFSGIHVEPGTYTNYVSCLLVIYVFSSDLSKKVMWISVASMFSVLMSHSASSMFFVAAMLLLFGWLWRERITLLQVLVVLGAIVFYVYASHFLEHLLTRFGRDDGSMSLKVLGINTYLQTSVEEKLIGLGFGDDPCTDCHYQDIGVVLNLVSRGGIILAFSFALLFFRAMRLHGIILATLIFSIPVYCIMSFYEAPIWLLILFATSSSKLLDKRVKATKPHATATVFRFARMFDVGGVKISPGARKSEFSNKPQAPIP